MSQYTPLSWRCRHGKCGTGCGSDSWCCQERGAWYSCRYHDDSLSAISAWRDTVLTGCGFCQSGLVLQLYFWPCTPFVVIQLSHPLVPAPPRGPFQHVTDGLLGRQHKSPEEAANLGDAQRDPPLRAALNAARLCNGIWASLFLGSALSCRYPARTTVSSTYAHMAKVICRYHPVQLRTS